MRDRALSGIFGALALALPTLFHLLGFAGALFLPMYWPIITLAFLVSARWAVGVALIMPWVSALLTGMPLLWPPLAAVLSVELGLQVGLIALARKWGVKSVLGTLVSVLVFGRFVHALLIWVLAQVFVLPAMVIAGISFLSGWLGVVLMLVMIPLFVSAITRKEGVCEVRFLNSLRRLHLPESMVLFCAQILRWFEALGREAEMLARAMELRSSGSGQWSVVSGQCAVEIKGLCVKYSGASKPALTIENLLINAGEKIVLCGTNGCGKTTFLDVLAGFVAFEGSVKIDNEENPKHFQRYIGMLFENPDDEFIFPTVREDVGYALTKRKLSPQMVSQRVDDLLCSVGLSTHNRPIATLSRGQRQRVALAGVLATEAPLLLLDEPTSALDALEVERVAHVLRSLKSTVIVATHDPRFMEEFKGRIVKLGI